MRVHPLATLSLAAGLAAAAAPAPAQSPGGAPSPPARAIRRDIPITNMIRRAFASGTRDSTGRPGRHYWQLWVDYTIQARLDPAQATVTGRETVVIHNNSDSAMRSVYLRLDQNILAANAPRARAVPEITDGMTVTRMALNGDAVNIAPSVWQVVLPGRIPARVSLAAFDLERTVARVTLPTPIPPHGTGTLELDWRFRVPRAEGENALRMGRWADSLFQVAQWYPRVAVFDDLRADGWDTEPYLGFSEFHNNFGRFDVTLDLPAGWVVGATGTLRNPEEVLAPTARERLSHVLDSDSVHTIVGAGEFGPGRATAAGDRLRWHFVADTASDFAWAASNRFVWDATRATIPGGSRIPVHVLYLPAHAQEYAEAGRVVRHALEFYSGLWIPYAFPQMSIVDGPERGMEYPMITFSSVEAADHETGHGWWPMMVGNDETWYAWMDEGLNVYMNILSSAHRANQPPDLDGMGQSYGRTSGDEREAPMMWNSNHGGPMYVFQAYRKAPLMLSMLGGIVGDTAVWRAMSQWASAWRFKHPSPWDYMFFMNNALGRDLGWFWYYWLFTTESVDGSIAQVARAGARTTVTVRQNGQMPSPVVLQVRFAPTGPAIRPMRNAVMVDSATAVVTWPVDVWFGGSRTFGAVLDFGPRRIQRIILDPRCRFPDRDPSDNVWPRDPAAAQLTREGGPRCHHG